MFNETQFTKITNSYMFIHRIAIFRKFTNTDQQKFNIALKVLFGLAVIFAISIYYNFNIALF
jgi:hypothetical protein